MKKCCENCVWAIDENGLLICCKTDMVTDDDIACCEWELNQQDYQVTEGGIVAKCDHAR